MTYQNIEFYHRREKLLCFIGSTTNRQFHPTLLQPISLWLFFILPSTSRSPKLMFALFDNNFYLFLNTRKYPLIRDVNSSSICVWNVRNTDYSLTWTCLRVLIRILCWCVQMQISAAICSVTAGSISGSRLKVCSALSYFKNLTDTS